MSDFLNYLKEKYPQVDFEFIFNLFFLELKEYMQKNNLTYFSIFKYLKVFKSNSKLSYLKIQVNKNKISDLKMSNSNKPLIIQIDINTAIDSIDNLKKNNVYINNKIEINEEDQVVDSNFDLDDLM